MTDQNCHFIFWRTEAADINLKKINKATDLLSHRKEKKKEKLLNIHEFNQDKDICHISHLNWVPCFRLSHWGESNVSKNTHLLIVRDKL